MLKIKRILHPTDFSPSANQALPHALFWARQYQAELHLLHAIVLHEDDPHNSAHHFPNVAELQQKLKDLAATQMAADIGNHQVEGLSIKQAQVRGIAPAAVILDYAQSEDMDLIVMGTHGHRGLEHLFMGSVAEEVVRMARCSVFTVRQQKTPKSVENIRNILVPLDFSDHSKTALAYAKAMAARYKAKLALLHIIEESLHPAFYVTGESSIFDLVPDIKAKSEAGLRKMFDETPGPTVEIEVQVAEGRAARDIVKFAEEQDSDLIVIATHGLTGIEHFLIGSIAEKVVRRAPCPVFTVKSFGKSLL
ncbi:MAG: universal stress protein [bacterium]